MRGYEEYIGKIREYRGKIDYDQMYSEIQRRVMVQPRVRLALASALAVTLLSFLGYFGYQFQRPAKGDLLMSYVFEQENIDGPVMDYVFSNGTFSK